MGFETSQIKSQKGTQTVKIPKSLAIDDDKVYIKKMGNILYIIPYHNPWQNLIESLDSFTPDFMDSREQTMQPERDSFD